MMASDRGEECARCAHPLADEPRVSLVLAVRQDQLDNRHTGQVLAWRRIAWRSGDAKRLSELDVPASFGFVPALDAFVIRRPSERFPDERTGDRFDRWLEGQALPGTVLPLSTD